MKRRTFIQTTAMASTFPIAKKLESTSPIKKEYKLGYQLFSINQDMNNDPLGTLVKAKAMGYRDFEIYGFDPDKVTYYKIPADEFKSELDGMGLTVTSGHYGFDPYLEKSDADMERFVDQCIKGAKALKSPYITWPWMDPKRRNMVMYKKLPSILNRIGQQISEAGLKFAYHNHGFEFELHHGQMGYDFILNETDPDLVKLQIDMYWVMHAGTTTPIELVKKHPGRFVMWHIKDMDAMTRDYTELGNGAINYINVLPDTEESGLEYYYIEQGGNFTHSALKSAETSAAYFQKYLKDLV